MHPTVGAETFVQAEATRLEDGFKKGPLPASRSFAAQVVLGVKRFNRYVHGLFAGEPERGRVA
jgi:hypothetical protein